MLNTRGKVPHLRSRLSDENTLQRHFIICIVLTSDNQELKTERQERKLWGTKWKRERDKDVLDVKEAQARYIIYTGNASSCCILAVVCHYNLMLIW